jgi:hypothetical protein
MLPRKFEVDFKEEISMCYMCVPAWLLPVFLKVWESVALHNLNKIKVREAKSTTFKQNQGKRSEINNFYTLFCDFICEYPGQRPLRV